jgi:Flp pilus assembly protein TadG
MTLRLRARKGPRERGSILVLTAISLTVLMGITALAIDASYLFDMRHRLEAAADAAALAASLEFQRASSGDATLLEFAKKGVLQNNFTPVACGATGGVSVCLNHPPTSGTHMTNAYVEIIVSSSVPTFFMKLFGRSAMTVSARSVAGLGVSPYCMISLATTKKGDDAKDTLKIEDGANVSAPGCSVAVNSKSDEGLKLKGTGTLTAEDIGVSGSTFSGSLASVDPDPQFNSSPVVDPLATLVEPSTSEACIGSTPYTIPEGTSSPPLAPGKY